MEDYKEKIRKLTQRYLSMALPGFKKNPRLPQFSCPSCNEVACNLIPSSNYLLDCVACNWQGDVIDAVKLLESKYKNETDEKIYQYLANKFNLEIATKEDIDITFKLYKRLGFDMVSVRSKDKSPFELDWQKKSYIEIDKWNQWIEDDLNIGVKTGRISNIVVVDIDCKNIEKSLPKEFSSFLENSNTLVQETQNGYHYFFKYDKDLPKTSFDIIIDKEKNQRYHIDIQSDGGQVVVFPSRVIDEKTGKFGLDRRFNIEKTRLHSIEIKEIPQELKKLILSKSNTKTTTESISNPLELSNFEGTEGLLAIEDGNRNNALMHIGGILRKELNPAQTENVLSLFNRYFVDPPLDKKELHDKIFKPLRKYIRIDENDLAKKVLDYMRIVGEASATDIRTALNYNKYDVDKATELLVKEGYLFKKRRSYHLIKKAIWTDKWAEEGETVDFEMPYFHNEAFFRNGDMIIVGAKTGVGKTHVAMNMVKQLVDQGKKPYYISLESGSRFVTIAKKLRMGEGDFYHTTLFSPEDVELEKDAITIIDWLLPDDYSQTDKLYKYFAEQLTKQGGVLIIFVQLKEAKDQESRFFAENMIKMFPALVVKFAYKKDSQGQDNPEKSYFESVKIRDPKGPWNQFKVHLKYNFQEKTLDIDNTP